MGTKKRSANEIGGVNEVVEIKRREIALEKGEPVYVSEELQAKRDDAAAKEQARAEHYAEMHPQVEEIIDDDMITEEAIQADREAKLIAEITQVLKVPKTRDSVPTFSMYSMGQMRRYFILDVDGAAYRKGWTIYKEAKGDDPVGYIDLVMHIMDLEIPRLHRAVDWAPLN